MGQCLCADPGAQLRRGARKMLQTCSKNAQNRHTHCQPRIVVEIMSSFPSAKCAEQTATRSIDWARFSVLQQKGEQHFRIRVCRNVENVCNSPMYCRRTCIHCRTKYCTHEKQTSPVKSNFRTQKQHPDARNNDCQVQGQRK